MQTDCRSGREKEMEKVWKRIKNWKDKGKFTVDNTFSPIPDEINVRDESEDS